jgi:hypothetical protein
VAVEDEATVRAALGSWRAAKGDIDFAECMILHTAARAGHGPLARFRPDGTRLKDLPGPKGKGEFNNPGGAAFDSRGALYFVDNGGCKLIYRYSDTKK